MPNKPAPYYAGTGDPKYTDRLAASETFNAEAKQAAVVYRPATKVLDLIAYSYLKSPEPIREITSLTDDTGRAYAANEYALVGEYVIALTSPAYDAERLTVVGRFGWGYTSPATGFTADLDASATAYTVSAGTPVLGDLYLLGNELVGVASAEGASLTLDRGLAGTTAAPYVATRDTALHVAMPYDLQLAAATIGKRWAFIHAQPGAGAYQQGATQGQPATPALTYNLRRTIAKYEAR